MVADAQARRVEVELGLLFGGDADAKLHLLVAVWQCRIQYVEFILVVQDGDYIVESVVEDVYDILYILLLFEAVAYDGFVFPDETLCMQLLYEVDVESRRSLEVDIVLQRLFQHE